MKRYLVITLAVLTALALAAPAWATNGYQLIGIGQNQKSMGGAVTAAPMDAMTAITNPAGMARIGNRADFSVEAFMPVRSVDFGATGGDDERGGSELYGIPALGWSAPAFNREDTYFGGGMYGTSGLGTDFGEVLFLPGAALDGALGFFGMDCNGASCEDVTFDGYSFIQFWKMAPTVAWNLNDKASVGISLNLDYQSVSFRQRFRNVPFWDNPAAPTTVIQREVNFDLGRPSNQLGYGVTIGGLYDATDWLTLGVSYSSKQKFENAEFRVGKDDILNFNGAVGKAGTYKMGLEYPQQAAIGIAVKPVAPLLIAFDAKWIDWSDTHDDVEFNGPSGAFDTNGPAPGGQTSSSHLHFGWEDQYVYALGIQYAVNEKLAIRTGYNYAKAPIDEEDVFSNLVLPAAVEEHWTLGGEYLFGTHWGIGATYMKAFKNTIEGKDDVPQGFQQATPFQADSGAEISLEEDSVGIQLSYRF